MVTRRRGTSSLGCLFSLLIAAVAIYFGVNVGEAYWRFYLFQYDMPLEVRFSANARAAAIMPRPTAAADSLQLPDAASDITVNRVDKTITVESEYSESVELPMYVRAIHFHPRAEGPL